MKRVRRKLPYWGSRLRRACQYSLTRTIFVLLLTLINPFDMIEESERRSRAVWQDVYAEGYFERAFDSAPGAFDDVGSAIADGADPPGRDDLTVLLIGDRGLDTLAGGDELDPFDIYDLVEQIQYAHMAGDPPGEPPRAIFLDMALGRFAPSGVPPSEILDLSPAEEQACLQGKSAQPQSYFRCMLYLLGTVTRYDEWGDDTTCQTNPVAKLACIRRSGGLPLIFADARTPDENGPAMASDLPLWERERAGYAGLAQIGILSPSFYSNLSEYALTDTTTQQDRLNADFALFPAAILYAQHCLEEADTAFACDRNPVEKPSDAAGAATWQRNYWGWDQTFTRPLEIIWGIGSISRFVRESETLTTGTTEAECEPAGGVQASAIAFGRRMLYGIETGLRERCFYPRHLTYEQITDASPELIDLAFSDRLVLVGLADDSSNDFVTVPTFGRVPGVFWHAMALDNLIVEGKDYQRAEKVLLGKSFSTNDANDMLALFLSLIGIGLGSLAINRRNRLYRAGRTSRTVDIVYRSVIFFAVVLWMLSIVQLLTGQIAAVPRQYNYAALTIIVFFEMFMFVKRILEPIREDLFGRVPILGRMGNSALERRY